MKKERRQSGTLSLGGRKRSVQEKREGGGTEHTTLF